MNIELIKVVDLLQIREFEKTTLIIELHQHIKQVQQSIDKPNTQ